MASDYASLCLVLTVMFVQLPQSLSYASFVFGDSLVDAGNNDYFFTLSKADSPPYGIDFALSGGRPTGRFTNGRTISDIIGQAMGKKSFPPPYLDPNTRGDAIFGGVNYASGSSGILNETGSLFIGRISLARQIGYFEHTRSDMIGIIGENATNELLKGAIFSITTGSNDILENLQPSIPLFGGGKVPLTVIQDIMVSNLTLHLKRLHELGARKLVVDGIGPLGCIPYVRMLDLVPRGRCSSVANSLVRGYNMKLSKAIRSLNQEMGPEAILVYTNPYDIVADIIRNYRQYGIENTEDPCCGISIPPFLCLKGKTVNSSNILCEDRSKFVFWDAFHPTEAANIIIASKLIDGDGNITSPMNIRKLYDYEI